MTISSWKDTFKKLDNNFAYIAYLGRTMFTHSHVYNETSRTSTYIFTFFGNICMIM